MHNNCITINLLRKFEKFMKFINKQSSAKRHYWRNMDSVDLRPPNKIRGMINLDRNAFHKEIQIPKLKIPEEILNQVLPIVKNLLLKMEHFKPVRTTIACNGGDSDDGNQKNIKEILLHPLAVQNWNDIPIDVGKFGVNETNFCYESIKLSYDNWRADEILKSILPEDKEGLTSFSRIGHIVHVNLRDHLLPYKNLIGEILKDKTVGCRTVVNKSQIIENTYRNFNLELICGDPDYEVEVKEHGCIFQFDFSKVYWNPRLSTEHERIVNLLRPNDVLYDIFAGVGPFSIPAARKKKCQVLANDLNPESYKWLNVNAKRNKCSDLIQTFNKDGRRFILEDLRADLLKRWTSTDQKDYNIHITMNLPAMAIEFLDAFNNLFIQQDVKGIDDDMLILPLVHVYTFSKEDNGKESVKIAVETHLGEDYSFTDNLVGIYFVRNVAPNKDMYRISFKLTKEIIFKNESLASRKRPSSSFSDNLLETSSNHKKKCE